MRQLKITQTITERTPVVDAYMHDISTKSLLTVDEETELAMRAAAGDVRAAGRLVEANLRFVVSVAKQYQNRGLELADLINEGNMGLMTAVGRFDPTRGLRLISYAVWYIRQRIQQAINDHGRTVRIPLNRISLITKIRRAQDELLAQNGIDATAAEVAVRLQESGTDVGEEDVSSAIADSQRGLSLDRPIGEESDCTLADLMSGESAEDVERGLAGEAVNQILAKALTCLCDRDRKVVTMLYGIGCSQHTTEQVGEMLGMTRERVRQLHHRAVKRMRSYGATHMVRYV